MNKALSSIAACLALTSVALASLTNEQLSDFKRGLANSDPAERVEALEELLKQDPTTAGNAIVPLLCSALRDPEARVRALAAASLASISLTSLPKVRAPSDKLTGL